MSIIKTQAFFRSTDGKNMSRVLIWKDDETEPSGILQIAHGLTDHIGRYDRFARFMASNGYIVCGNDHIGHGLTAPSQAELGNFGEPDSDIRMIDDMHTLQNIMSRKYPGLPHYLLGHSLGSLLSRIYASLFGDELSGLILCGTIHVSGRLSLLQEYVLPFGEMIGRDTYSSTGSELLGKITAKYFKEEDENAWLSVSKENRNEADCDPYFDFPITNGSAMIVAKILLRASSDECFAMIPSYLPVFLISGGKDPVGMFGRGVLSVCTKLEENGNEPEMKLYPGLRHEILNEDDYQNIYDDILNWINSTDSAQGDYI
ncbi:MAG: alpha/beta fold hydrolase [Clostridia bacterium]|nr:alpha/beta fold hydrolase [Clostridia bacterium]